MNCIMVFNIIDMVLFNNVECDTFTPKSKGIHTTYVIFPSLSYCKGYVIMMTCFHWH